MQPARHALAAEQEHREERRLEKEGGQNLVAEQRPDDVADDRREPAPVGADLIGKNDARDDAHAERHGKDPGPKGGEPLEAVVAGPAPQHFEGGEIGRKPDREARKDNVERDGEGELQPRQQDGIELHGVTLHRTWPRTSYDVGGLGGAGKPWTDAD
jgi:hypothetical protein